MVEDEDRESMMSANELKAVVDAANRRVEIEIVVPEGFAVMVNGVQMAPVLGTEQNPAKALDELPDGTGLVVDFSGTKFWYKNWRLHCEDGPAVEWSGGSKFWYRKGEYHREDGPAVECSNGYKEWWVNGEELSEAEFLVVTQKNGNNDPVGSEQNPAKALDELPDGTGLVVMTNGTKEWYLNGHRHREDGPAVEWSTGTKFWYKNGELHRVDGPAVEWSHGSKEWYLEGEKHRVDGPAVEGSNGYKAWYLDGEKMTEAEFLVVTQKNGNNDPVGSEQNPAKNRAELPDGTGLVAMTNGTKFWFKNNKLHREDGPAVEWSTGTKFWYLNGALHREDGPAVEGANGSKEYWLHGQYLTEAEFLEWIQ